MTEPVTDLSAEDHATLFADPALAAIRSGGGAVIVASADTRAVLLATQAALALFNARDRAALAARLFGSDPGARRLSDLARTLSPGAGARLERLRFFLGPIAETLTLMTRRVALQRGSVLVLAAPATGRTGPLRASAPDAAANSDALVEAAAAAAPAPAAPARPRLNRFVWQTGADGRLIAIEPDLADLLGGGEPMAGADLAARAAACGADPDGLLAAALSKRATFASLRLNWPLPGGREAVPVDFFGVPAFDVARRFAGWRGFGVAHPERIALSPGEEKAAAAPVTEADKPAETDNVVRLPLPARAPDVVKAEAPKPEQTRPELVKPAPAPPPVAMTPTSDEAAETPPQPVAEAPAPQRSDIVSRTGEPVRLPASSSVTLTESERNAFREIARTLGARSAEERGRDTRRTEIAETEPETADLAEQQAPPAPVEAEAPRGRDILALATPGRPVDSDSACCCCGGACGCSGAQTEEAAPSEADLVAHADALDTPAQPIHVAGATPAIVDAIPADLGRNAPDMLDRLPIGVLVSRGSIPIYANRTLLDLLGFTDVDDLHDGGGLDHIFRGRPAEALSEAAQGGATPIVARDGTVIPVDGRMQTIQWDGDPATLMSFRRSVEGEIAFRMRTLETELRSLQNVERELHSILDTATDGVAVIDDQGRILSLNRSAEALFGYEQNEVAGDSFTALLAPSSHRAALDYLDGLKSNGVASVLNDGREVMGRERQGGTLPLFMTMGRITSANGGKFCAVLRDMTQWKKAERDLETAKREAERASALKSDFLAKISHEIRTPLNAILGFAEVIMHERFGPIGNDRYKDYLKDIHASGTHVMSLVNDLLDLSKIESGKLELSFAATDVNRIVSECVSLMQAQALQERVILRVALAPRLPNIVADERSLRQIVLNLLSNGVKFNEPGGQVIVSTALTDAGHAVIRVRDTGIGMSDAEIDVALEPFRQLATSRNQSGTGLGLPLTKALVEANRASFTIKSKKTEGTLVEVAFPPTRVLAE